MNPLNTTLRLLCALGLLAIGASQTTAHAARLALVIGNDSYTYVDKLQNARDDARLMAQTLRDAQFEVTTLENQDSKNLFRALETFGKRVQSGDEVVFFFAGHGVQINNDAVLLPTDIRAESDKQVLREGLQLSDVQDALKDAKVSLLVIDACRDNPFPKQGTRSIGGSRGLIAPEVRGQAVILSAGRNQKALDRVPGGASNNGLFTHEFVNSIKGGLDLRAALVQVRDRVDDQAKRANHDQRPSVVDDLRGNFYFFAPVTIVNAAPPAPSLPAVRLQSADEIEQQAWDATQQANTAAAFSAYLTEYPRGRFASAARVRLAGLMPAAALNAAPSPVVSPSEPYPAGKVFSDCAKCPDMVVIPAGQFTIGSSAAEQQLANAAGVPATRTANEQNGIAMQIARFALAQTETTRGHFARFVAATQYRSDAEKSGTCSVLEDKWISKSGASWRTPGFNQTDKDPVTCVSANDARAYIQWINTQANTSQRSLDEVKRNRGSAQAMNAASMPPPSIALCCIEATDLWN